MSELARIANHGADEREKLRALRVSVVKFLKSSLVSAPHLQHPQVLACFAIIGP